MRRSISLFFIAIVIIYAFIPESIAETFTIHSGVTFGMNHEEVSKLESDSGFEVGDYEEYFF